MLVYKVPLQTLSRSAGRGSDAVVWGTAFPLVLDDLPLLVDHVLKGLLETVPPRDDELVDDLWVLLEPGRFVLLSRGLSYGFPGNRTSAARRQKIEVSEREGNSPEQRAASNPPNASSSRREFECSDLPCTYLNGLPLASGQVKNRENRRMSL